MLHLNRQRGMTFLGWLIVMALGSALFFVKMSTLRKSGADVDALFKNLPEQ